VPPGCHPPASAGSSSAPSESPPHQYLLTRRLERAAALLRVTDWPVADVCFAGGAGSVESFMASFGRVLGRSPTAYRRLWPPAARFVRIPRCMAMAYARPQNRTFREDLGAACSQGSFR
jgi:helix-turn-helix protein